MFPWQTLARTASLLLLQELLCWLIASLLPPRLLDSILESLHRHAQRHSTPSEDPNVPL